MGVAVVLVVVGGVAGLNGGCCQELIALGCSAGPRVYSTLTLSLRRTEEAVVILVVEEVEETGGGGTGGGVRGSKDF